MPVLPSDVQPVADAAAPAPVAPDAAPAPAGAQEDLPAESSLPEEVLKIPAMAALLNGSPPATYAPLKSKIPEIKTLTKHAEDLKKAGFAAFESESLPGNFVLFNGLIVKPDEVMQADKAGQLDSMAVPFDQLTKSFESARKDAVPAEAAGEGAPAAPAPAGQAAAAPVPVGAPAPAGAQKRLLSARVANLMPGSPTSGAMPGRGRVLNAISKSVV
jgi:hypothetical protein